MPTRKTLEVAKVLASANNALATATDTTVLPGICSLLEHILQSTGNYRGFAYIGGWRPAEPDFNEYRRRYY